MRKGAAGFAPSTPRAYSPRMQKLRPYLTALLGLLLWFQGLAIAAAPIAVAEAAASAMEMPCHDGAATDGAPFNCCDSDCPNMAGCILVSFAGTPATATVAALTPQPVVPARGWSAQTAVPPLPLRPPIASRA